jgi:hypothetical protein
MDVDSQGKPDVRLCWNGPQKSMLVTRQDLRRLFSSTWQASIDKLWRDTATTQLWVNDTIMVAFCQLLRSELASVSMDFFDPITISEPHNDGYNRRAKVGACVLQLMAAIPYVTPSTCRVVTSQSLTSLYSPFTVPAIGPYTFTTPG